MCRVLTVDIGNSNIVVGSWKGRDLEFSGRLQTKRDLEEAEISNAIKDIFRKEIACGGEYACEGAILSSVVPEINDKTLNVLETFAEKKPLLMGPSLKTQVDISDYQQGAIGMDRIVDLTAAISMYGSPVMVCDLGTCTTITVAGSYGKVIGGMICPGIQMSLDAEKERTSQLPGLSAGSAEYLLGKDTPSNMMSGVVAGTGLMISDLAKRLSEGYVDGIFQDKENYPLKGLKVVITGGLGQFIMPWIKCDSEVIYEPDLLLKGLLEIYMYNKERTNA